MNKTRKRTIIYVDGFNLYYGVLKGSDNKWLDLQRLFTMLRHDDEIVAIKYFTTIAAGKDSRIDQLKYLQALATLPLIEIIEGRFKPKRIKCRAPGCSYHGNREFIRLEEKQTDVNIAVQMVTDAYENQCDQFIVISGDSDLVPALKLIKSKFPTKILIVYVPAQHIDRTHATELRAAANKAKDLPLILLKRAQFPNKISDGSGGFIEKPADW